MTVAANAVISNETTVRCCFLLANHNFHRGSEQVSTNIRLSCGNVSEIIICYKTKQEAVYSVQCTSKYLLQYDYFWSKPREFSSATPKFLVCYRCGLSLDVSVCVCVYTLRCFMEVMAWVCLGNIFRFSIMFCLKIAGAGACDTLRLNSPV